MTNKQEEKNKQEQALAAMGSQVLNNEAYIAAIGIVKRETYNGFCDTKPDQSDVREEMWRTMRNLNGIINVLNDFFCTGNMNDLAEEIRKRNNIL